jgi:elongation factor 3
MAPAASQDAKDIKSENSKSLKVLEEMMSKLTTSKAQDEINASAQAIATFINGDIEEADAPTKYVQTFILPHHCTHSNIPLQGCRCA